MSSVIKMNKDENVKNFLAKELENGFYLKLYFKIILVFISHIEFMRKYLQ